MMRCCIKTIGCWVILSSAWLSGCAGIGGVWTGANLVYDRQAVIKKLTDYQLVAQSSRALYRDQLFKRDDCSIDLAAINGDLLIAGHVATRALRDEAYARIEAQSLGYRRFFRQLATGYVPDTVAEDAWITAKVRSQITADSNLDPRQFKIITSDRVVYIMGDAFPDAALRVIDMARKTSGVIRVVKLLKYYHLSDQA